MLARPLWPILALALLAGCGGGSSTPTSPDELVACLKDKGRSPDLRHVTHIPDAPTVLISGLGKTAVNFYASDEEAANGAKLLERRLIADRGSIERHGTLVVFVSEGDPDPAVQDCV